VTGNVTSGGAGAHDLINWFGSLMTLVDSTIAYTIVNPTDGTSQNLLDYAVTDKNALQAVQEFAETVHGVVFTGADGTVRATANGGTAVATTFNTYFVFDQPGINLAANVVPYTVMDYDLTTQYLYNDITVNATSTWEGSRNAQNAASIAAYGKRSLALQFPYMGYNQAAPMANTLLLAYCNPKPRVHALTIDVDGTTGIVQSGHTAADLLFGLEITAPVTVVKAQPGNVSINRAMIVEGIKHDIKPDYGGVGTMHEITLQLTDVTNITPNVWKLGVSKLGIDTILAYGPSFDPTTIPGCTLYLRSDLGVTTSGVNVTQWLDQSGNIRNATPVGSPPQIANVQNGYPSIRLDGTSQYFTLASSAMGGANWTVFTVFKLANITSSNVLYAETATPNLFRMVQTATTSYRTYVSDGTLATNIADATTLALSTCYVGTSTSANGNPTISYVNGDTGTSGTAALGAYTPINFRIGAYTTTSTVDFFGGDLLCVIVYNSVLSSADRATVRDALKTLYAAY
jgi:hypothetical protein